MKYQSSWVTSGSIVALLVTFFILPWVTISCSGVSESANGYELASGNIDKPDDNSMSSADDEDTNSYPVLWLLPLVSLLAAYGVYLREMSIDATVAAVRKIYLAASGVGLVAIFLFYTQFSSDASDAEAVGVSVSYEIGLWVAVLAAGGIGVAALYFLPQEADAQQPSSSTTSRDDPLKPPAKPWE